MARKRNFKRKSNNKDVSKRPSSSTSNTKEGVETKEPTSKDEISDSKDANTTSKPGYNDPAWYTRFPELAFGSSNLPYGEPFGSLITHRNVTGIIAKVGTTEFTFDPDYNKLQSVSGVCALKVHPSYGLSYDRNDPLNVAAQMFYTNVRYVNSGRKNYEAADLMLYSLAIAELYSFIMYCQRLYGYGYMYSQRNYFVNGALVQSNGLNKVNLVSNLANFRYWLNAFINKVSSFAVPADIALFARRIFMFAHLYTESTTANIKDQLYQFVPDGFYKFVLDDSGKGKLEFKRFQEQAMTTDVLMAYGEDLLANIFGDEDFGLMSGDIIKAYGSNIIGLTSLPEEVVIIPEYEEFVLSQFKNATIVGTDVNKSGTTQIKLTAGTDSTVQNAGDIFQANGNLICVNVIAGTKNRTLSFASTTHLMSVTNPMPDINDNMECSRLVVGAEPVNTGLFHFTDSGTDKDYRRYIVCGSDFIVSAKFYTFKYDTNGNLGTVLDVIELQDNMLPNSVNSFPAIIASSQFKWSPLLFIFTTAAAGENKTNIDSMSLCTSVDNYTMIDNPILKRMHESALLSLTYVPGVSKVVG